MCFLGAMLIVALMVSAVAYSTGGGPAAPVLATPANAATGQPQAPTLIWNASTGADTYRLQVSTASDFLSGIVFDGSSLTATSQLITGLALNTTYYWHVNATGSGSYAGTSAYSTPSNFQTWGTIPSPGPAAVTLGSTAMFAILSYTGITSSGTASTVTGDIGVTQPPGHLSH
jgi:hypothetical protein